MSERPHPTHRRSSTTKQTPITKTNLKWQVATLTIALHCLLACDTPIPPVQYTDITPQTNITFTHQSGAAGQYFLIETMGAGAAFFDYDNDGHLDIYLVNGFDLSRIYAHPINLAYQSSAHYWVEKSGPLPPPASPTYAVDLTPAHGVVVAGNALYHNNGDATFTDITQQTGVGDQGYGMGCAVADYDNDGHQDLYVTNFGPNVLYRNNGDATFTDITAQAGVAAPQWSTSAAFFDYDNDGQLDLYIANYLNFTVQTNKICGGYVKTDDRGHRAIGDDTRSYCSPDEYGGVADVLYHNNGDATFADVSIQAGIASSAGKGLGVVAWDYDTDGDQDLFVANDGVANFLYQNNGDGTFADVALSSGIAYNARGEDEACMGVDFGDYDNDGDYDLFVTNFSRETNTLYRNDGERFIDVTAAAGLSRSSWSLLGFGTNFLDYDHDGDLDLYIANGHVLDKVALFQPGVEYAQKPQLLRNDGGRYADVSDSSGAWFSRRQLGRSAAFGDYDNDGDIDLLATHGGGPAALVRNDGGNGRNWSMVKVVGKRSNRDGVGAEVRLTSGNRTQVRQVRSGSSYLSASDPRLHFGLGASRRSERLEITWPSGLRQHFEDVPVNEVLLIEEGEEIARQ